MPTSMRAALRERVDLPSLALIAALVAAVTLAFGFTVETALLMFGGAVVATLADAAVHAGRLHRQTVRAALGVVIVAAGWRLAAEGGWTTNAVVFVMVPFGLGGAWTAFDAVVSRWRGVVEPDGSVGGVPDVPALVANVGTVERVRTVLGAADRPLTVEAVAGTAELDPDWTRRVLALLVVRGDVERRDDGYLDRGSADPRSTAHLLASGTLARLGQPFGLLAGRDGYGWSDR